MFIDTLTRCHAQIYWLSETLSLFVHFNRRPILPARDALSQLVPSSGRLCLILDRKIWIDLLYWIWERREKWGPPFVSAPCPRMIFCRLILLFASEPLSPAFRQCKGSQAKRIIHFIKHFHVAITNRPCFNSTLILDPFVWNARFESFWHCWRMDRNTKKSSEFV